MCIGTILVSPIAFFFIPNLQDFTLGIFVLILFLAVIFLSGVVSFYEALRIGSSSLVGAIAASFAALVVVLSALFLHETLQGFQILAVVTIFIGILLSTLDIQELRAKKFSFDKSILLALFSMVMWAIYFTFIKIPVVQVGWFWPNYLTFALFPFLFLLIKFRGMDFKIPKGKTLLFTTASTGLTKTAQLSFNFAIQKGFTSVVAPIAGSYPTLFVALAFLVFRDPITKQQIIGIIVTLVGIVSLAFSS